MRWLVVCASLAACHPHRRSTSPPPPVEQARAQIASARQALADAEAQQAAGDFRAAYEAALRGVDALGRDYLTPTAKDDTGQHLALADELARAGQIADAAREAIASLRSRIAQYEARYR